MAYNKQHKYLTRRRILREAYQLFFMQGYDQTSIEQIMEACGLTRGGFYAHFSSKQDLYTQAMESFPELDAGNNSWAWQLLEKFVDFEQLGKAEDILPLLLFATGPQCDQPDLRTVHTRMLKRTFDALCTVAPRRRPQGETALLALAAMVVGAEVMIRTTDDHILHKHLTNACWMTAKALQTQDEPAPPTTFFWEADAVVSH